MLTVDESREQTKVIHDLQREAETFDGLKRKFERERILTIHRNAQRLLRPLHVVNPYAKQLTFLSDRTRTRRDHTKYLTLIRTITLLHQHQRPLKEQGGLHYIEVESRDIEAANKIAHEVLGRSLDELSPQTRRLLILLREMVDERCKQEQLTPEVCLFSHLLYNSASELELPRLEKCLPKHILSHQEAETILNQPDVTDPFGMRDRAILEVLYSTGLRRMEIANLKLHDLDSDRGTLMVRQGKGKKDRMIPIGERAILWVEKYVEAVRPSLVGLIDDGTLFLTNLNEPFTPNRLTQLVRDYVKASEIGKQGACHLFRHTCATLMHENGADIRFIQQLLGHADLSTTQSYTQVAIRKLKEIHTATHPAKIGNTVLDELKAEIENDDS